MGWNDRNKLNLKVEVSEESLLGEIAMLNSQLEEMQKTINKITACLSAREE